MFESFDFIFLGEIRNEDLLFDLFVIRISNIRDSIEENNYILVGKN